MRRVPEELLLGVVLSISGLLIFLFPVVGTILAAAIASRAQLIGATALRNFALGFVFLGAVLVGLFLAGSESAGS